MAAAHGVGGGLVGTIPLAAGPVAVAGDRLDVVEGPGIEVLAALPLIASALDHVEKVRDDTGLDEALAVRVEVNAPRVAGAVRERLENVPRGMVAPHAGVERHALGLRCVRLADLAVGEHAVAAVEPAVRPPDETVHRLVRVLIAPAVKHDFGWPVGMVITVRVGNGRIGYAEQHL